MRRSQLRNPRLGSSPASLPSMTQPSPSLRARAAHDFVNDYPQPSSWSTTTTSSWRLALALPNVHPIASSRWRSPRRAWHYRFTTGQHYRIRRESCSAVGTRIAISVSTVQQLWRTPPVESLIRAAIAQAKTPLPATGKGHTIIKSVSAKQRPRRPAGPLETR